MVGLPSLIAYASLVNLLLQCMFILLFVLLQGTQSDTDIGECGWNKGETTEMLCGREHRLGT